MRISSLCVMILIAGLILALACDYAVATEAVPLGPGDEATAPEAGEAPPGKEPSPAPTDKDEQPAPPPKGGFFQIFRGNPMLLVMLGGMFLLFMWMGRSKRKQAAKRKEMLTSLKKGDKVTTIGGVIGAVVEIREDEITVKVDESNNNRLRFARWAIRGVGDQAKIEGPEQRK